MPFIIDARNMGGGSIGSAAGGDTSPGTRNNVTLAAPWDESKEYLKGDLATNNGDLYQAQKSVPAGVQISDEDYWALVVVGDKSKETEQLRKDIGSLGNLETESKDNLVDAINEVGSIQSDWNQNDETAKDYIKNRPFYEGVNIENLGTTFEGWRASCQSHGEDSMVINANVAGIDYQDVEGLVQTDTNGRYVHYYFGENRDYRIEVDRGMAQVTIRPAGTEYYFYKVSSTVKQIDPKYLPFEQADWNQNDDTKKDYIKGRTHWAEIKPVVEKVNIITDASYKYNSQGSYKINGAFMCPYPPNIELTEGTPITITIETKSFTGQLSASTDTNLLEFSLKNQQVNGYKVPSAWYFDLEQHSIRIYGEGSSSAPAMSFSITAEIEQEREVVHTLDPKYIKDMYYTETKEAEVSSFVINGGTSYAEIALNKPLVLGHKYIWTDSYSAPETGETLCTALSDGNLCIPLSRSSGSPGGSVFAPPNSLLGHYNGPSNRVIKIVEVDAEEIHQIDPKYIPNQIIVFEARLFPDSSIPNKLNLESGIAVGDLVNAFDEGRRVIARVCVDEDDDGIPFEMQRYYVDGSSGIPYRIIFAPCSISGLRIGGAIGTINTMVIEFIDGNWYFSGFALDAIGEASGTPYTIPFEVNAMYYNTFAELESATQDFRWRAYIYKGDHKLYLQVPEYSPSATPSVLYFTGITEPDDTRMSRCVWTTIKIPVSSSNVILWDDSTLPISNTALDTWENYRLDKDQSGALYIYDIFNNKIDLGLVGAGVIEYQGYRYLFNKEDGAFLEFYCTDFTNKSEPKISTIELNRRINRVTVTDFQPLWEIATESEVNNAVDDIFKTI